MKRFGVYLYQGGGCDYTIACGYKLVLLPEIIQTMQQAHDYVLSQNENEGSIAYYGTDRVAECVIYEITDSFEVDMDAVRRKAKEDADALYKEERRRQYEKLKREFE